MVKSQQSLQHQPALQAACRQYVQEKVQVVWLPSYRQVVGTEEVKVRHKQLKRQKMTLAPNVLKRQKQAAFLCRCI